MKPDKLSIFVGGYTGSSYSVELKRGALVYTRCSFGFEKEESCTVKPSPEAWEKFLERLDEADVWSWSGRYDTPGILDGTDWSAVISVGERSVEAGGSNGYPPASSKAESVSNSCEPDSHFSLFCDAVSELLGGREFDE